MIGKLICFFKGHKRGRRIGTVTNPTGPDFIDYQCPRCLATWTRKVKSSNTFLSQPYGLTIPKTKEPS